MRPATVATLNETVHHRATTAGFAPVSAVTPAGKGSRLQRDPREVARMKFDGAAFPETAPVPDGLPVLTTGSHRNPDRGSCVMEYVSVLAGERFSDHPRCTDPALAVLARGVNDTIGAATRRELAELAPDLIRTHLPERQHRTPAVIVACCARAGLAVAPSDTGLRRMLARAERRLARLGPRGSGWTPRSPGSGRLPVSRAFARTTTALFTHLDGAVRDRALLELLADAIARCRALDPAPDARAVAHARG
jgi:hypothetical protein